MALDAAHGEQRHEAGDDDGGREEDALVHLGRRVGDDRELAAQFAAARDRCTSGGTLESLRGRLRQAAEDVLHHDDGGIDDQPEIDGADGQQIGGLAAEQQQRDRESQRERDGRRDDDGGAQVAEEDPLQEENQHDALRPCCAARCGW